MLGGPGATSSNPPREAGFSQDTSQHSNVDMCSHSSLCTGHHCVGKENVCGPGAPGAVLCSPSPLPGHQPPRVLLNAAIFFTPSTDLILADGFAPVLPG